MWAATACSPTRAERPARGSRRPRQAAGDVPVAPAAEHGCGADERRAGPDGSYYVGELSGFPFNVGAANLYRVSNGQATVYCAGFTAIISIAFGPDGQLYVLQFASAPGLSGPGVLYRIDSGCTKTPVVTGLFTPGGLAFGDDGAAYISQGSILASGGTVWRFEPGP